MQHQGVWFSMIVCQNIHFWWTIFIICFGNMGFFICSVDLMWTLSKVSPLSIMFINAATGSSTETRPANAKFQSTWQKQLSYSKNHRTKDWQESPNSCQSLVQWLLTIQQCVTHWKLFEPTCVTISRRLSMWSVMVTFSIGHFHICLQDINQIIL